MGIHNMKKTTGWKIGFVFLSICFMFQLVGTVRYFFHMPDDSVGVTIYFAALAFFAIGAVGFYVNWRKNERLFI